MDEKAKGTPRRTQRYSPELMQRALSLLAAGERPSYISTLLGVPFSTISTWKKAILHVFKTWQKARRTL